MTTKPKPTPDDYHFLIHNNYPDPPDLSITDYLAILGHTKDQVADRLREQGAKGLPKSADRCAIIVGVEMHCYLPWGSPRSPNPGVLTWNDLQIMDPCVPKAVADFMRAFDEGEYPDLVGHTHGTSSGIGGYYPPLAVLASQARNVHRKRNENG